MALGEKLKQTSSLDDDIALFALVGGLEKPHILPSPLGGYERAVPRKLGENSRQVLTIRIVRTARRYPRDI